MAVLISRCLSVVIAVSYLTVAAMGGGAQAVVVIGCYLLLPLACIWFSDEMGAFTGVMRGSVVTSESPGCLVAAGGWLLLLLPVIIGLIGYAQGRGP